MANEACQIRDIFKEGKLVFFQIRTLLKVAFFIFKIYKIIHQQPVIHVISLMIKIDSRDQNVRNQGVRQRSIDLTDKSPNK